MQNFKKYTIICRASFYAKMKKSLIASSRENKPHYTPMNTPLCMQIRQGQFSWHLESERTTCVSKERCLAVGRMILMMSLAFLLKLIKIIEKKSSNCVSIVLGFRQFLGGVCMKILVTFKCTVGVHFEGNTPKLVEWVSFRNFGFKVNLVTKTLSEWNKCIA